MLNFLYFQDIKGDVTLCDGVSSYIMSMFSLLWQKDKNDFQIEHGLGHGVVYDMTRDLVHRNHHVYFDRFFTVW